ncbi:MAG: TSUP family transporter, partial [Candidatus Latescibacteria bacterium]|nr:TSUP family transporter [Candidatus Latescibacterota bacterium]
MPVATHVLLALTALVAASLSGAIGMGGGVLLLAVMASVLPPAVVVPIHGVVQLVSNSTRSLRLLRSVNRRIVLLYVPPMVVGAFVGLQLYRGAEMSWFRPAIGLLILAMLGFERFAPRRLQPPLWVFAPAGLGGGILTILLGVSGPYLAMFFLRDDLTREEIVATKAGIQMFGHLLKIPAFLSIGFAYRAHLDLLVPLCLAAVAGTLAGTWLLRRMGERLFRIA